MSNVNIAGGVQTLSNGTNGTSGTNGKGKDFIKLFNQALGKTSNDPGWEDRVEQEIIPNTGYKNWDKDSNGQINVEDLKLISPDKATNLSKVNQSMGKKAGDPGWEDRTEWVRRWGRGRYYWTRQVIPGYNRADFDHNKRVEREDLFAILKDTKDLSFLKEAYGKAKGDAGWEDKTRDIFIQGHKNLDLNVDNKIDQIDLQILFAAKYEDGTLIRNNDKIYAMIAGGKRLIPDEKTFGIMGFDHKDEITISEEEFALISDLGELPKIKYGDGSIIKESDDKLYLMNQGMKIEIPDKTTYEALGLNVSDHTFTIRAKGRADDGVFPIIQLRIDGQVIKEWFVTNEYGPSTL
ncbi:MAG: hypothetical protein QME07_01700 [bacterium]|nr:hypothetical protein [bacterium]